MNDLCEKLHRMRSQIIRTPIVAMRDDHLNLHAKLEFKNWTGSLKIRSAWRILYSAALHGKLHQETTVVESTSGNFGVALTHLCHALELNFVAIVDPNVNPDYEKIMCDLGTEIIKVSERDDTDGYLKTRLAAVSEFCQKRRPSYWPNQYENLDNALAHEETGGEILEQLENVDYVFVGVSTAGTIAGISRKLKSVLPRVKIIAVDAVGSVIFGSKPGPRSIPGIGSSIVPPLLGSAFIDDIVWVTEEETIGGCHELWNVHDIFAGGSSGSIMAAIRKYFHNRTFTAKPNVLFLCADGGEAYRDKIKLIKCRNSSDSRHGKLGKNAKDLALP